MNVCILCEKLLPNCIVTFGASVINPASGKSRYASFFITCIIENKFLIFSIQLKLATPFICDELYHIQDGNLNKKKTKSKTTNCLLFTCKD